MFRSPNIKRRQVYSSPCPPDFTFQGLIELTWSFEDLYLLSPDLEPWCYTIQLGGYTPEY